MVDLRCGLAAPVHGLSGRLHRLRRGARRRAAQLPGEPAARRAARRRGPGAAAPVAVARGAACALPRDAGRAAARVRDHVRRGLDAARGPRRAAVRGIVPPAPRPARPALEGAEPRDGLCRARGPRLCVAQRRRQPRASRARRARRDAPRSGRARGAARPAQPALHPQHLPRAGGTRQTRTGGRRTGPGAPGRPASPQPADSTRGRRRAAAARGMALRPGVPGPRAAAARRPARRELRGRSGQPRLSGAELRAADAGRERRPPRHRSAGRRRAPRRQRPARRRSAAHRGAGRGGRGRAAGGHRGRRARPAPVAGKAGRPIRRGCEPRAAPRRAGGARAILELPVRAPMPRP